MAPESPAGSSPYYGQGHLPAVQRRDAVLQDSVKCSAQVQVDGVWSSLIYQCCNPVAEGYHVCQAHRICQAFC